MEQSDYDNRSKKRGRIDLDEDDEQEEPIVRKQSLSPSETANQAKKLFYKRSFVPSSEQSAVLKQFLKPGKNEISFHVLKSRDVVIKGNIFYWDYTEKIVISDVDGTITKSDFGGHVFPRLGISDWAHEGIAKLYSDISKNGYQILYLTSRAIGLKEDTLGYLKSIKQGFNHVMPDGPLLLSPDRTAKSIYRELIIKKPHHFKIECLTDIKALFPESTQPFYAGFGNRETDAISYRAVAISLGKIFIINPKGVLKQMGNMYCASYPEINAHVDMMFPAVNSLMDLEKQPSTTEAELEDQDDTRPEDQGDKKLRVKQEQVNESFNEFNYWN